MCLHVMVIVFDGVSYRQDKIHCVRVWAYFKERRQPVSFKRLISPNLNKQFVLRYNVLSKTK